MPERGDERLRRVCAQNNARLAKQTARSRSLCFPRLRGNAHAPRAALASAPLRCYTLVLLRCTRRIAHPLTHRAHLSLSRTCAHARCATMAYHAYRAARS